MRTKLFLLFMSLSILTIGCKKDEEQIINPPAQEDWTFPANSTKFSVTLYCEKQIVRVGETFDVKVILYNIPDVFGTALEVSYTSSTASIAQQLMGPHFTPSSSVLAVSRIEAAKNAASYGITYQNGSNRISSGSGVVVKFKCTATTSGNAQFTVNRQKLEIRKADGSLINNFASLQVENLTIVVQ